MSSHKEAERIARRYMDEAERLRARVAALEAERDEARAVSEERRKQLDEMRADLSEARVALEEERADAYRMAAGRERAEAELDHLGNWLCGTAFDIGLHGGADALQHYQNRAEHAEAEVARLKADNAMLRAGTLMEHYDRLRADNARLREALEGLLRVSMCDDIDEAARRVARAALAGEEGTP